LFQELWDRYPRQEGRKAAFNKFKSSVKTEEDLKHIHLAMNKYLNKLKNENTEPQFIKMGSTFFNQWEEILDSKQITRQVESKPALTAMSWLESRKLEKQEEIKQIG
jgi:ATP-dependent protease HslVU (ClpYQ) ATPase subunit